jgi:tRNA A-37 threonylcarbamoyl transferase component Bud32
MVFGRAERICGPFYRLHLATARIDGARSLLEYLRTVGGASEETVSVLKAAGECVRALHDAGILHADLNLNNLLVVAGNEGATADVRVIDLDGSCYGPSLNQKGRAANLARLLRHAVKNNLHGETDLDGLGRWFMEGYCRGGDPVPLRKRVLRAYRRTLPLHRISWRLQGITIPNIPFGG